MNYSPFITRSIDGTLGSRGEAHARWTIRSRSLVAVEGEHGIFGWKPNTPNYNAARQRLLDMASAELLLPSEPSATATTSVRTSHPAVSMS